MIRIGWKDLGLKTRRSLLLGGALVAAASVAYLLIDPIDGPVEAAAATVASPPTIVASSVPHTTSHVLEPSPKIAAPPSAAPASQPASLRSRIETLLARNDPESLLKAHTLVARCNVMRDLETANVEVPGSAEYKQTYQRQLDECKAMPFAFQRDFMTWLNAALAARVPGSSVALLEAGPNGDISALTQRPDDPLVLEWKRTTFDLLMRDAKAGNADALRALSSAYGHGLYAPIDPKLDAALEMALTASYEKRGSRALKYQKEYADRKLAALNPTDQAWAKDFAAGFKH